MTLPGVIPLKLCKQNRTLFYKLLKSWITFNKEWYNFVLKKYILTRNINVYSRWLFYKLTMPPNKLTLPNLLCLLYGIQNISFCLNSFAFLLPHTHLQWSSCWTCRMNVILLNIFVNLMKEKKNGYYTSCCIDFGRYTEYVAIISI